VVIKRAGFFGDGYFVMKIWMNDFVYQFV